MARLTRLPKSDGGDELAGAEDHEADDEGQGREDRRPADALLNKGGDSETLRPATRSRR